MNGWMDGWMDKWPNEQMSGGDVEKQHRWWWWRSNIGGLIEKTRQKGSRASGQPEDKVEHQSM
jgi:hypothetical protein